ncbi:MAG TPA: endopeptidase La [Actinobacteria bacterium]|nr:endopeptidase La [Actinomycetota bacterium]
MARKASVGKLPKKLPLIPLRNLIVFPNLVVPLFVGRTNSIKALEGAMKKNQIIALVAQKGAEIENPTENDLYEIGTVANVMQELKLPDGTAKALVEGMQRIRVKKYIQKDPYFEIEYDALDDAEKPDIELEALMRTAVSQFEKCANLGKPIPQEALLAAMNIDEGGRLADYISFHMNLKTEEKQKVLEALDHKKRIKLTNGFLEREIKILEIGQKIQTRVKNQMSRTQREYLLREQLKAIQGELGDVGEQGGESEELRTKIKEASMPEEVEEKALKELDRLSKMSTASAESSVIRTYIDWLIGLPWTTKKEKELDIKEALAILDSDHHGLDKVKERVLEHLAVHKLSKELKGPILCFVGPPGVGKTSIGKSIAKSLGREFVRISLGGVRDEAEIRGHRRTYVGALPGRIIQSLNQVKSSNPVFMMDEIDKIGADFRGDPSSALLEVLDPEQNSDFRDHYLEVPYDLKDVFFITTANLLDTIPPALRDRMEIIHFPGYTEDEKLNIGKKFLVPKQLKAHGIKTSDLRFSEKALSKVIKEYTREAGVRQLERSIAAVCRQVAKKIVEKTKRTPTLGATKVNDYLGTPKFHWGVAEEKDQIGVATGLAWTEVGGDIIKVEAAILKGNGKLMLTGHLGKVMQESAQAALSYIRGRRNFLELEEDFYEKLDLHIHVPAGAIPKDGPSAGITMATALVSALIKQKVRKDVCMTGEITLRGHVLPIGGLKEKLLAAHRAGIRTVVVPKENKADLDMVPKHVLEDLNIELVRHMDDVLNIALDNKIGKLSLKVSK